MQSVAIFRVILAHQDDTKTALKQKQPPIDRGGKSTDILYFYRVAEVQRVLKNTSVRVEVLIQLLYSRKSKKEHKQRKRRNLKNISILFPTL